MWNKGSSEQLMVLHAGIRLSNLLRPFVTHGTLKGVIALGSQRSDCIGHESIWLVSLLRAPAMHGNRGEPLASTMHTASF